MFLGLLIVPMTAHAQDETFEEVDSLNVDVGQRMLLFMDELNQLNYLGNMELPINGITPVSPYLISSFGDRIKYIRESLASVDVRWNTYYQAQQAVIASDEDLMGLVADYQKMKQVVDDSLVSKQQVYDALVDFQKAEIFILVQDSTYRSMGKRAFSMSLVPKMAPMLEKLKAKEQLLFADIQEQFGKAQAAAKVVPALEPRLDIVSEQFATLKSMSEKIQGMAYKPFIQRIKDYLISLAAVAIMLLFFNFAVQRLQTLKKMHDEMKKVKKMMNQNGEGDQYPTI